MHQKFRNMWIAEGDQNTSYFHNCVKARSNQNKIVSLTKEDGTRLFEVPLIHQEAISHFENLLTGKGGPSQGDVDFEFLGSNLIQDDQAAALITRVTREEVKNVVFKMKTSKAPGPDGFNVCFYQTVWPIIGEDFIDAVLYFFEKGRILKELNHTALTLIPKVANPSRLSEFRPNSWCNVMYKCISKIMANRIKAILPNLINEAQATFVPGRSIDDSILIA